MTLSPIERLPNELLAPVFLYLRPAITEAGNDGGPPSAFRMADVVALMKCSRRLHEIGSSILWENLFLALPTNLTNLTRTCIDRPDLPASIKVLRLTQGGTAPLIASPSEHARFMLKVWGQAHWDARGTDNIWLIMLTWTFMGYATNLKELLLDFTEKADMGMVVYKWVFQMVLHMVYNHETPIFPGLQKVCFLQKRDIQNREISIRIAYPLLKASPVTTFYGEHIVEDSESSELDEELRLVNLVFKESALHCTVLDNILKHYPKLEVLTYEHEPLSLAYQVRYPFYPKEFGMSLKNIKSTLKELNVYRLDVPLISSSPHRSEKFLTIGPLTELEKLEKLSITTDILLGTGDRGQVGGWWDASLPFPHNSQTLIESLPSSIEQLELVDCCSDSVADVVSFLEYHYSHPAKYPNFKKLFLTYTDMSPSVLVRNKDISFQFNALREFRDCWAGHELYKKLQHWLGLTRVDFKVTL